MKSLLVDWALEHDPWFNEPTRDHLERVGTCTVWSPDQVLSSSTLRGFSAIVLGGVPCDLDRYPFEDAEGDISRLLRARIPLLGICLGHQLVGTNRGGQLLRNEEPEEGVVTVALTPDGRTDELFHDFPDSFEIMTMHAGSVGRTEELTVLADSDNCRNQAMVDASGLVRGVQFHPERSGQVGEAIFFNLARIASNYLQDDLAVTVSGMPVQSISAT